MAVEQYLNYYAKTCSIGEILMAHISRVLLSRPISVMKKMRHSDWAPLDHMDKLQTPLYVLQMMAVSGGFATKPLVFLSPQLISSISRSHSLPHFFLKTTANHPSSAHIDVAFVCCVSFMLSSRTWDNQSKHTQGSDHQMSRLWGGGRMWSECGCLSTQCLEYH